MVDERLFHLPCPILLQSECCQLFSEHIHKSIQHSRVAGYQKIDSPVLINGTGYHRSCPFLVASGIASIIGCILHGICQHIGGTLRPETVNHRLDHTGMKVHPVKIFPYDLFNPFFTGMVFLYRGTVGFQLIMLTGICRRLMVNAFVCPIYRIHSICKARPVMVSADLTILLHRLSGHVIHDDKCAASRLIHSGINGIPLLQGKIQRRIFDPMFIKKFPDCLHRTIVNAVPEIFRHQIAIHVKQDIGGFISVFLALHQIEHLSADLFPLYRPPSALMAIHDNPKGICIDISILDPVLLLCDPLSLFHKFINL